MGCSQRSDGQISLIPGIKVLVIWGWTERPLPSHALWLALVSCAILSSGLVVLSGPEALAAEGERPAINGVVASYSSAAPEDATLEAQIDPNGSETRYEFWLQCQSTTGNGQCEPMGGGPQAQGGHLPADFVNHTAKAYLVNLEPNHFYWYGVVAVNAAGRTERTRIQFETNLPVVPPGACSEGCSNTPPYRTEVSQGVIEGEQKWAEGGVAREAARERMAREQAEREAAANRTSQLPSTPPSSQPVSAADSVSLAATHIVVHRGVLLVKLGCIGSAACNGTLALSARLAVKARSRTKRTHKATIGRAGFLIPGDEVQTVKLDLDAAGQALLSADHGHLSASLAIVQLASSPESTQTMTVHLAQPRPHAAVARRI